MKLSDFDFTLPKELIALYPKPKGQSRMLDATKDIYADRQFTDIFNILERGDIIVLNETKVIPTELRGFTINSLGVKTSVRLNLLEELDGCRWIAYAKPAKKLQLGSEICFADSEISAFVERKSADSGEVTIIFRNTANLHDELEAIGNMPLPPYIKRSSDESDRETYQTVFAKHTGSVAAPTAGLHFSREFLEKLEAKGVNIAKITLHVGRGTFEPVKVDEISEHKMHSEFFSLDEKNAAIIRDAKKRGNKVLCVGTTTMRTLESIAVANDGEVVAKSGHTDIFIMPGFEFKVTDLLLTNFHLPKSTLFILISAILSLERAKNMYEYAVNNQYRFFSYGDCCLLTIK